MRSVVGLIGLICLVAVFPQPSDAQCCAAPELVIEKTGTTNESNKADVSFKFKNLGTQKLNPTNWFKSIKVAGTTYTDKEVFASDSKGVSGKITVLGKVPAGKHTVVLKVLMSNGTTLEATAEVTFSTPPGGSCNPPMSGCCPPPPCPPPSASSGDPDVREGSQYSEGTMRPPLDAPLDQRRHISIDDSV